MANNNRESVITKEDESKLGIEGIYDEDERIITMIAYLGTGLIKKSGFRSFFEFGKSKVCNEIKYS